MEDLPFDLNVLTNPKKKSLTVEYLRDKGIHSNVYLNEEWPMPPQENWHQHAHQLEPKQEISYRIFRGHQECLQLGTKDYILCLEDDAKFAGDWLWHTKNAMSLLDKYDAVLLYAKATSWVTERFTHYDREYLVVDRHPTFGVKWVNGAVAYLVKRETAKKIHQEKYVGIPYDVWLVERFNCACSAQHQCAFEHSTRYGSTFHNPTPPD